MNRYLRFLFYAFCILFVSFSQADDNGYTLADVKGNYGFSFNGQIVGYAPIAAAGVITADGKGNIPKAVRTISVGGMINTQTFSCTYTINPNGTGSAFCPLDAPITGFPNVETFDFVMQDKGKAFRIVGTTPGVAIVGTGKRQW